MITYIKGTLTEVSPTSAVIEVNGIGYNLLIPLSTFDRLPKVGSECKLLTHLHIREHQHQLFGFITHQERDIFRSIIGISGIGPKMALTILSGMNSEVLYNAIVNEDVQALSEIPGVGKKTAQRIIVELRGKLPDSGKISIKVPIKMKEGEVIVRDAIKALVNLGYKNQVAQAAVEKVIAECDGKIELEELLKKTLKYL